MVLNICLTYLYVVSQNAGIPAVPLIKYFLSGRLYIDIYRTCTRRIDTKRHTVLYFEISFRSLGNAKENGFTPKLFTASKHLTPSVINLDINIAKI